MHFLIVKNAYWTKWTPQPQQTLSPTRTPTPSSAQPHTTTLEIIQAYFIQINPPPWGSNQKTNIHMYLKIPFQVGFVLHKIAKFSIKYPLPTPFFQYHNSASGPQVKNPHAHFCLPRQILSKMVWHNPTKLQCYHISGKIPGKGTTHPKVTNTNLATP